MPPKRKPRKPRGSRGVHDANPLMGDSTTSTSDGAARCDMMVLLPKDVSRLQSQLQIKEIMARLASTGFTHMALTHTIYGRPRPTEDRADVAIPKSLWTTTGSSSSSISKNEDGRPNKKMRKSDPDASSKSTTSSSEHPPIRVLRRLHAVLENLADVGVYLSNGPNKELLNEYDIVSVSPRNEATFQSACASATVADIITLDYSTTRGLRLPFKIRSSDVKAVMERHAAFEIPFAPALLHGKLRKALVQTGRELQTGSLGSKPCVLFSSGDRTYEESDVGAMALRMPGDLANLMQTVLHFDPTTSHHAVGASGLVVLKRAEERRWGKSDVAEVTFERKADEEAHQEKEVEEGKTTSLSPSASKDKNGPERELDEENVEDGFITMS